MTRRRQTHSRVPLVAAFILAMFAAGGRADAQTPPSKDDDSAVRTLPARVAAAFPDGTAVSTLMTEDADYIIGDGTHLRGRAAIIEYFQRLMDGRDAFGTTNQGARAIVEVQHARFLADDVALVHTSGGILMPGETEVPLARRGIQTWVAVKRTNGWLIAAYHNTRVVPQPYGGTEIRKLSPGTRGIVLLLLYLALDDADHRPLIIDQPEENLDPKSVNDELVPLFQKAKERRQVVMVTHNANLVVNVDADQILVADVDPNAGVGLPSISYSSGGLDEAEVPFARSLKVASQHFARELVV